MQLLKQSDVAMYELNEKFQEYEIKNPLDIKNAEEFSEIHECVIKKSNKAIDTNNRINQCLLSKNQFEAGSLWCDPEDLYSQLNQTSCIIKENSQEDRSLNESTTETEGKRFVLDLKIQAHNMESRVEEISILQQKTIEEETKTFGACNLSSATNLISMMM